MKNKKMSGRFLWALIIFSLTGQIAWVVENMYFNVFIYKMFGASAAQISLMVAASAAAATVTTVFIGALSDKIGKRKLFICGGYILWGVSIWSFAFIREDVINALFPAVVSSAAVGVSLVIIMDCVMTFFGSAANDAAFNAWLTDSTDSTNRGAAEGINAMMPLVAILAVFGGFMAFDLDRSESWVTIYGIIGSVVLLIGILGIFLIEDKAKTDGGERNYFATIFYGFRPSVIRKNSTLYIALLAYAVFSISIQIFMPYLILYYSVSLGMDNYVVIMAPAIIIAAAVTVLWGRIYDKKGFVPSVAPTLVMLMAGYVLLYFFKGAALVFIGSLLMMCGYLSGCAVFGAVFRDYTPENKAGMFQGLRIVGQVLIPGIIGPFIGASVLKNAETVIGDDGRESFIPNENIFAAAFAAAVLVWIFVLVLKKPTKKKAKTVSLYTAEGEALRSALEKGEDTPIFDEYPRPLMKRDSFFSLNGEWELKAFSDGAEVPEYCGRINVPFTPQSLLSGVDMEISHGSRLLYRREFSLPEGFDRGRVLLNFGAVDRECTVRINGSVAGSHKGGYFPFTLDVTQYLSDKNVIEVSVSDCLDRRYPYGKQSLSRGGMWYTAVSGIWQTVWLESVPQRYITRVECETEGSKVKIKAFVNEGGCDGSLTVFGEDGDRSELFATVRNGEAELTFKAPVFWTPEKPKLYDFTLTVGEDTVSSYFAFRTLETKVVDGIPRLCLNGEPYFFHGLLDQGYYSDGIFLPAVPDGFKRDILETKALGFNTLRKHIKIEPQIFYSMCDRLGMAVFQDMVNNGSYSFVRDTALPTAGVKRLDDKRLNRDPETRAIFRSSMEQTVELLKGHPCICLWTVFNEGWGQFEGNAMYDIIKALDSTRFVDTASGWFYCENSDVISQHVYFKKFKMPKTLEKPLILSEFGGYSYKEKGHVFNTEETYGYRFFKDREKFEKALEKLYLEEIVPAVSAGLCAAIYTQVSDVEDETNGIFTYDRRVSKVSAPVMISIADKLKY